MAVDGVLVLRPAHIKLHVILQAAVVPVPLHGHACDLALRQSGVVQSGPLGGVLTYVLAPGVGGGRLRRIDAGTRRGADLRGRRLGRLSVPARSQA